MKTKHNVFKGKPYSGVVKNTNFGVKVSWRPALQLNNCVMLYWAIYFLGLNSLICKVRLIDNHSVLEVHRGISMDLKNIVLNEKVRNSYNTLSFTYYPLYKNIQIKYTHNAMEWLSMGERRE